MLAQNRQDARDRAARQDRIRAGMAHHRKYLAREIAGLRLAYQDVADFVRPAARHAGGPCGDRRGRDNAASW